MHLRVGAMKTDDDDFHGYDPLELDFDSEVVKSNLSAISDVVIIGALSKSNILIVQDGILIAS